MRLRTGTHRRSGKTLILFALLLPVLLGLVGLVVDGGLVMANMRVLQNAADAAALAAAVDLKKHWPNVQDSDVTAAKTTATNYVQQYNNLSNASVAVNIAPKVGNYSSDTTNAYVEVVVSSTTNTWFVQVLGAATQQTVSARAVAGVEWVPTTFGLAALKPTAVPGLQLRGSGTLQVNAGVLVNSQAAGYDENLQWVDLGVPYYALILGSGKLEANKVLVVGGADYPANCKPLTGSDNPLQAGISALPDPLKDLVAPTTSNGVDSTSQGDKDINGNTTVTLSPGVYGHINISGSANVTFSSGVYVLKGGGLTITDHGSATGNGVLIYNTGSDYSSSTGNPDSLDGESSPPASGNAGFGPIYLGGDGNLDLEGITNATSPFYGMVIYQRRLNTQPITINAQGSATAKMKGTIYAKWADVYFFGPGSYDTQIVAGTIALDSGSGTMLSTSPILGKSPQVFLVE